MDKDFKPVYIRGTETGKGVIEALKILGGKNNYGYTGKDYNNIYYILPSGYISAVTVNASSSSYIMATAEEIKPAKWRAERGETYYALDSTMNVMESREYGDSYDNGCYESGNYFRTRREAKEMAEKIKKVLLPD